MPFTFAHPAAILPFVKIQRAGGWVEALIAGTLVPDLLRPLFALDREVTHSLWGWLLLDTPVALLLAWLIHRFLTPRIRRLPGLAATNSNGATFAIGIALAGAALGGLTHLGWDLFTHDQSPFTRGPILSRQLFMTPAGPFLLGQTLWYINSAGGLLALGIWLVVRIRQSTEGLGALLSGTWIRLLLLPAVPFLGVVFGFQRVSGNAAKDLFLHIFYLTGELPQIFLICSAAIFLSLFLWETRSERSPPSGLAAR